MAKEKEQLAEAVLNHALEIICLLTVEDFIVVKRPSDGTQCTFSIRAAEITSTTYDSHSGIPELLFTLQGVENKTQKMVADLANKIVFLMSREVTAEFENVAVYSSKDKCDDLEGHVDQQKKNPEICTVENPIAPVQQSAEKSYPLKCSIKEEPREEPLHTADGTSALPSPPLIPGTLETRPLLPEVNVYIPYVGSQSASRLILFSPCDLKPPHVGGSTTNTMTSLGAEKPTAPVQQSTEKSHHTKHCIKEEPEEKPHRSTDGTSALPLPEFVPESPKSKPPLPAADVHISAQTIPESGFISPRDIKPDPDEDSETTIDSMDTDTPQSPSSDREDEYTIIYQIKEEPEENKESSASSFGDTINPENGISTEDEDYEPPKPNRKKSKSRKSRSEKMPPPCEVCGKVLCSKSTLEKHLQIHTGDRPFICNECGQRFSCKNHLTTHERSHSGERPFACKECGRKFFKQQHLVLHQVVHTGEKPYTCPVCGKGFTRQSSVVKHSGMHAEQKPHVCNVCGKSYCQYASLVVHQRLHSGEKPFVCQFCKKAFTCKATMLKHEKSHLLKSHVVQSQC